MEKAQIQNGPSLPEFSKHSTNSPIVSSQACYKDKTWQKSKEARTNNRQFCKFMSNQNRNHNQLEMSIMFDVAVLLTETITSAWRGLSWFDNKAYDTPVCFVTGFTTNSTTSRIVVYFSMSGWLRTFWICCSDIPQYCLCSAEQLLLLYIRR